MTVEPRNGVLVPCPEPTEGPATTATAAIPNQSGAHTDERLAELWLACRAPSTRRKYAEDLGKFLDFNEDKPLAAVTLSDLHDFASFISVPMAPSSQGRVLATIKSLVSFANKAGYLPFDVGAAVELPKVEDAVSERILSGALLPAKPQLCITGFGSPEL